MNNFLKKNYKFIIATFVIIIIALAIEIAFFMLGKTFVFSKPAYSVLSDTQYTVRNTGYEVSGVTYTPVNNDPQIIISGPAKKIKTIFVSFESTNYSKSSVQVYYHGVGEGFSAENVIEGNVIPFGVSEFIITLPDGEYEGIRLDINGIFDLEDIFFSAGEVTGVKTEIKNDFSPLRFFVFVFLLELVATLYVLAFKMLRFENPDKNFAGLILAAKDKAKQHPVWMLTVLMLGCSLAVFSTFLLHGRLFIYGDIGSDTYNVYYPFFMSLQRKLSGGDFSLWDFTHGLGANALTRQADIGSIFTWITVFFGAHAVKYMLPVVQIVKIFLSGYACYYYLDNFKLSPLANVLASFAFAFNGFTMLWGQHYFFATASFCAVFLLFGIERAIKSSKGHLWLTLASAYVCFNSYYFAYMILLFGALYGAVRLVAVYNPREFLGAFSKTLNMLCAVLIGVGMSAVLFLPSAILVLTTSGRVGTSSIFEKILNYLVAPFYDTVIIKETISRFFSNNFSGTYDYTGPMNYYEAPQLFMTSFTLFFTVLFVIGIFTDKGEFVRHKILKLFALIAISVCIAHPLPSMVLNGFATHFFRYTFLLMPLFALLMAYVLSQLMDRKIAYAPLKIGCAAVVSVAVFIFIFADKYVDMAIDLRRVGIFYVVLFVFLALTLVALQKRGLHPILKSILMCFVIFCVFVNVTVDSRQTTLRRELISELNSNIYNTYGNSNVKSALDYIEESDKDFHRTEKTFVDVAFLNDALLEGYYGISVYNSVVNKNIIEFVDKVCPEFNTVGPDGYYDFSGIQKNKTLLDLMGVEYILSLSPLDESAGYKYLNSFGEVMLYKNNSCNGVGKFVTGAISYDSFMNVPPEKRSEILGSSIVLNSLETDIAPTPEMSSSVSFQKPKNNGFVQGYVTSTTDGWLLMPIPYENGWRAFVDGKEVKIERGDIAFIALELEAGEHEVIFKYNTPTLTAGLVISVLSTLSFITMLLISKARFVTADCNDNKEKHC